MVKDPRMGAYMIGVVSTRYGVHPQTLRLYEREGLLCPSRTEGKTRLYSDEDLERLEFIPLQTAASSSFGKPPNPVPDGSFAFSTTFCNSAKMGTSTLSTNPSSSSSLRDSVWALALSSPSAS